jgi:hypothetical protein
MMISSTNNSYLTFTSRATCIKFYFSHVEILELPFASKIYKKFIIKLHSMTSLEVSYKSYIRLWFPNKSNSLSMNAVSVV